MQVKLTNHLKSTPSVSESGKAVIVNSVLHSTSVQFYWSIATTDDIIQNEEWSNELLTHVIRYWLNIRGFSLATQWMDEYKHMISTVNKKGLRKELKNISIQ